MVDHRLLMTYELDDEAYAFSSRSTVASEFLCFCNTVQWMTTAFTEGDAYGSLVESVSSERITTAIAAVKVARAALTRKSRRAKVSF